MPNPTRAQLVPLNTHLTEIAINAIQSEEAYIADKVFPYLPVKRSIGEYRVWEPGDFLRVEDTERAAGTESNGGGYRMSTADFKMKRDAWHKDLTDEDYKDSDSDLDVEGDATLYVTSILRLKREKIFADAAFKTGVWTGDQTGVAAAPSTNQFLQFNDAAATPVKTIRALTRVMHRRTGGLKPNTIVMGGDVWDAIIDHPTILDRMKYAMKTSDITVEGFLSELFRVENVYVGDAVYNSAKEGLTPVYTPIYGKALLMLHVTKSPSKSSPSAGYTLGHSEFDRVRQTGAPAMKRIEIEERGVTRIEGEMYHTPHIAAPDLGTYLTAAVA